MFVKLVGMGTQTVLSIYLLDRSLNLVSSKSDFSFYGYLFAIIIMAINVVSVKFWSEK